MSGLMLWIMKKLMTQALYKKVTVLVVEDGLGYLAKKTDNEVDDKLVKMVVDALRDDERGTD